MGGDVPGVDPGVRVHLGRFLVVQVDQQVVAGDGDVTAAVGVGPVGVDPEVLFAGDVDGGADQLVDPGVEFLDDPVAHFDAAFLGGAPVGCRHKDRLGTVLLLVSPGG